MGGPGSGNWYRINKKSTVEESLALSMRDFRKRLNRVVSGTFTWTWTGGNTSSIGYFVNWNDDDPFVLLHYRWRDTEDVKVRSLLVNTPTQFGGRRWWFVCPLIVRGMACNRRVGKLYLPPGAKYFGCRVCHDLTYRSCQEAHHSERVFARMGLDAEVARMWKRRQRNK